MKNTLMENRGSIVKTEPDKVNLLVPTAELLESIRALLPFGLVHLAPPRDGARFGLATRCGTAEYLVGILQTEPSDETQGYSAMHRHSALIARSLAGYRKRGNTSLVMPCPYIRELGDDSFESGIVFFYFPDQRIVRSGETKTKIPYDTLLGPGFMDMFLDFLEDLTDSVIATGMQIAPAIALEVSPVSLLGSFALGFMTVGSRLVCLKTHISKKNPNWAILRDMGIKDIPHMPCLPLSINEDDLTVAKSG